MGEGGQSDWLMIYVPGARAKGQHVAFERKPVPRIKHSERNSTQPSFLPEEKPELFPEPVLTFAPEEERLVSKLVQFGVAEEKSRSLVKTHREAAEAQIAAFPYRGEGSAQKKRRRLAYCGNRRELHSTRCLSGRAGEETAGGQVNRKGSYNRILPALRLEWLAQNPHTGASQWCYEAV